MGRRKSKPGKRGDSQEQTPYQTSQPEIQVQMQKRQWPWLNKSGCLHIFFFLSLFSAPSSLSCQLSVATTTLPRSQDGKELFLVQGQFLRCQVDAEGRSIGRYDLCLFDTVVFCISATFFISIYCTNTKDEDSYSELSQTCIHSIEYAYSLEEASDFRVRHPFHFASIV